MQEIYLGLRMEIRNFETIFGSVRNIIFGSTIEL